jgi:hypothetical protein
MHEHFTKEEALKIALRHWVTEAQKNYEGQVVIHDGVPDGLPLYVRSEAEREYCWCIFVPRIEYPAIIGAGRYICISKETGAIVFDGYAGE